MSGTNAPRVRRKILLLALLAAAACLLLGCAPQLVCEDASQYPACFTQHPYLRTGYLIFPETIPESGLANGAEFYDSAQDTLLDPSAEIVLRCTYDDEDFKAELLRLAQTVKRSPAGEKPLLQDGGCRFSVPAFVAQFREDQVYEYVAITDEREITYVYLACRQREAIERVPESALPRNYAQLMGADEEAFGPDSYNVYQFTYPDYSGQVVEHISYQETDLTWPVQTEPQS